MASLVLSKEKPYYWDVFSGKRRCFGFLTLRLVLETSNTAAFMSGQPTTIYFKAVVEGVEPVREAGVEGVAPIVVVLIDTSGSMKGVKIEAAREAAYKVLEALPDDSLVAIYMFSDTVELVGRCERLGMACRGDLEEKIGGLRAKGGTNMYGALEKALAEFEKVAGLDRPKRLFLLTDGKPTIGVTRPQAFYDISKKICSLGVEMTLFGVGEDYNEELLNGMLQACGRGVLEHIVSPEKIPEVMVRYAEKAANIAGRNARLRVEKMPVDHLEIVSDLPVKVGGREVVVEIGDVAVGEKKVVYGKLVIAPRGVKGKYKIATFHLETDAGREDVREFSVEFTDDVEEVQFRSKPEIAWEAMGLEALKRGDIDALKQTLRHVGDEQLKKTLRQVVEAAEKGDRKTLRSLTTKTLRGTVE